MSDGENDAEFMNRVQSVSIDSLGDIGLTDKEVVITPF